MCYQYQITPSYKIYERILNNIVKNNTRCTDDNDKLELVVYYKSKLTSQLIKTNNNEKKNMLNSTKVVYQFICPNEDCMLRKMNNIGSTTTTLSRRLTMHLTSGAIREHQIWTHHSNLTREHGVNNTSILLKQNDIMQLFTNQWSNSY